MTYEELDLYQQLHNRIDTIANDVLDKYRMLYLKYHTKDPYFDHAPHSCLSFKSFDYFNGVNYEGEDGCRGCYDTYRFDLPSKAIYSPEEFLKEHEDKWKKEYEDRLEVERIAKEMGDELKAKQEKEIYEQLKKKFEQ